MQSSNVAKKHKLELFGKLQELIDFVEPDKKWGKNWYKNFKVLDDELSQGQFNQSLALEVGRTNSGKAFNPKYSYNWTYDFFSLVELVKVESKIDSESSHH